MAKKKSESTPAATGETKPKTAARTKKTTKAPEANQGAAPMIDPAQAAAAAAALVAHRAGTASGSEAPRTESSSFRQLKESLNKPHAQTMGGLLDKLSPGGQRRQNQPFNGPRQVGHNQTFGADVNRKNVPRRTGG